MTIYPPLLWEENICSFYNDQTMDYNTMHLLLVVPMMFDCSDLHKCLHAYLGELLNKHSKCAFVYEGSDALIWFNIVLLCTGDLE